MVICSAWQEHTATKELSQRPPRNMKKTNFSFVLDRGVGKHVYNNVMSNAMMYQSKLDRYGQVGSFLISTHQQDRLKVPPNDIVF